jgi:serine/threonine-protein kinase
MTDSAEHTVTTSSLTHVCRLADGGMGRVDLAMRRVGGFKRMYAIKRLHPHLASDPDFRAMFLDEARIAGRLRHPNVVGVLDVGEDAQGPFLVMDFVDGLPLSNLMRLARKSEEPIPVQLCLRIAIAVAQGLHAAHDVEADGEKLELVHRDLTPQNIMIGWDGSVRITDFGIAKAFGRTTRTATGVIKGKMAYMAPEQVLAKGVDRRADLYSLGIVLFEMLSGERFHGRPGMEVAPRDVLESETPDIGELRPDVPDELVQLMFELLAKSPEARPPTAREVALRLERCLATLLIDEETAHVADYVDLVAGEVRGEQKRFVDQALAEVERSEQIRVGRRRTTVVALLGVAAVVGLGVAMASAWPSSPEPSEPDAEAVTQPESAASPPSERTDEPGEESDLAEEESTPSASEETPAMRRRRRPRRRTQRMAMSEPAMEDAAMHRLPEWVGFER